MNWNRFLCHQVLIVIFYGTVCYSYALDSGLPVNSSAFIDVTRADGVFVKDAVIAGKSDDETALLNTQRIHQIMNSGNIGDHVILFFPSGDYYFNGAVPGAEASIESSGAYQTFAGADMNASRIFQLSPAVSATMQIRHDGCTIRDLYIGSADRANQWREDWESHPHQSAIHLDGPDVRDEKWPVDPKIENVNINSLGNTIKIHKYSRPFRTGILVTGAWLNIYAHNIWMTDLYTAIDINQGPVMGGPAKFIDVNFYCTHEREKTKVWSTFFKSNAHFMEQVELIHCTFIGAQFIYMDGRSDVRCEIPGNTPLYNMVIDHNYVNVVDTFDAPERESADPKYSGIYMNLPPKIMPDGTVSYSRDIRFTNNSCTGRATKNGGFFYVTGMCRGITISENEIACGFQPRCIVIDPLESNPAIKDKNDSFIAVHDVKITNNYFRTWANLLSVAQNISPQITDRRVKHVLFANNQSYFEIGKQAATSALELSHCEDVCVDGNQFADSAGTGVSLSNVSYGNLTSNSFEGLGTETSLAAVKLNKVDHTNIHSNTMRKFVAGISSQSTESVSIMNNIIQASSIGIDDDRSSAMSVSGNHIDASLCAIRYMKSAPIEVFENVIRNSSPDKGKKNDFEKIKAIRTK